MPTVLIVLLALVPVGICFLGVVAAVAIPAFTRYVRRSKTSEAMSNLRAIYSAEVSYWNRSFEMSGSSARFVSCSQSPAEVPNGVRAAGDWSGSNWPTIGFSAFGPVYYQYSVVATGTGQDAVATIRAIGDLDGDGTTSMFERTLRIQSSEVLGSAITTVNELE